MSIAADVAAVALENVMLQEDAVVLQQNIGSWSRGVFVEAEPTRIPVKVVTAPVAVGERTPAGNIRKTLPEGLREKELRSFWLKQRVRALQEGETPGDSILYDGGTYQVVRVNSWGGVFYEAIGALTGRS